MSELDQNLDALLDTNLDDLADLPDFVVAPAGAYRFTGKEFKVDSDDDGNLIIILVMILNETVELANTNDKPIADGTIIEHRFNLANEFAQGILKNVCNVYKAAMNANTLREVKEVYPGSEGEVVLTVRAGKQTPEQKAAKESPRMFQGIKTLELA